MRVCGLLEVKSEKRFYRRCPNSKPQQNPSQRGFRLIFQAGGPAFLRLPPFFPVVGTVKVSGSFIDRLTNPQNGPILSPQDTGGSAPFFRTSPVCQPERFLTPPPPRPSPLNYLPDRERTILFKLEKRMSKTMNIGIGYSYCAIKNRYFRVPHY